LKMPSPLNPLLVLVGPTAVGKTEVSLLLAEHLTAKGCPIEIVSADSRLFYRGMDIGTAKPTLAERARAPHHLMDVSNPDETWSMAQYQQEARRIIAEIHQRGGIPLLVGGTGQYVRAVIENWEVPPVEENPRLRAVLETWAAEVTPAGLHTRLAVLDPVAAARIEWQNLRRTIRALEVIFTSGQRFSAQQSRGVSPYDLLQLGLTRPRPELYARIDIRIEAMLTSGLIAEVQGLLNAGYEHNLAAFSAIGYAQVISHLRGECTLEEAVIEIKRLTRQFVRRQANWFKLNDPAIRWFEAGSGAVEQMEPAVEAWLRGRTQD
jgi:tRNA dimethylallyltransferase